MIEYPAWLTQIIRDGGAVHMQTISNDQMISQTQITVRANGETHSVTYTIPLEVERQAQIHVTQEYRSNAFKKLREHLEDAGHDF